MSAELRGKPVADAVKADVKARVQALKEKGCRPLLSVIRTGERADDLAYEKKVLTMAEELGIEARVTQVDPEASQEELESIVSEKNSDPAVHGILMFRPLPRHFDEQRICGLVSPEKDIDCMNPENLKKLFIGDQEGIAPCTPEAVVEILKYYEIPLTGADAVIVNRSLVLGKPLSMLLLRENATVTVCHSKTKNLPAITSGADIFISGIGRAEYFDSSYVSGKTTAIDVGINFSDGRMCGDMDYDSVKEAAAAVTPVPGGVGTVTTSILMRHLVEAAEKSIR